MARARIWFDFDAERALGIIIRVATDVMDEAARDLARVMSQEALITVDGNGPGRPSWRRHVSNNMDIIRREMQGLTLRYIVGYTDTNDVIGHLMGLIVALGVGSGAGGAPLYAGPYGRPVFGSDLEPTRSEYVGTRERPTKELPAAMNQVGNDWLNQSVTIFANERFPVYMARIQERIPQDEIIACMRMVVN